MRTLWKTAIVIIVIACVTTGCGILNQGNSPHSSAAGEGYSASQLERETDPNVVPDQLLAVVRANTVFGMAFFNEINKNEDNLIFSPFSLSLALSMTMAGAETSTEEGILQALSFRLPEPQVHPTFNELLLSIEASELNLPPDVEGQQFDVNIANSIWGQAGLDFKQDFLDTLALNYGAGIFRIDFASEPETARLAINEWISKETEERITDMIPPGSIDPMTRLVLANAIYFNGSWLHPFEENQTEDAPFTLLDGSINTVDMMHLSGENLRYLQGENFQAIQLPYLSSDFSMLVVVPDIGSYQDVESFLTQISVEEALPRTGLDLVKDEMGFALLDLYMPKFDFESEIKANDALMALGMSEAFTPGQADFSGMTEEADLFISDVLHKANITLDESGTEAAAATVVLMRETAMEEPEEPVTLVIDRPFLFFIQHNSSGTVLFMGRVMNP
jgi:serpin B